MLSESFRIRYPRLFSLRSFSALAVVFVLSIAAVSLGLTETDIGWTPGGECTTAWLSSFMLFAGSLLGFFVGRIAGSSFHGRSAAVAIAARFFVGFALFSSLALTSYFEIKLSAAKQILVDPRAIWSPSPGMQNIVIPRLDSQNWPDKSAPDLKEDIENSSDLRVKSANSCTQMQQLAALRWLFAAAIFSITLGAISAFRVPVKIFTSEVASMKKKSVFIVHGWNTNVRYEIERYLRELRLDFRVMQDEAHGGRSLAEKFEDIANDCDFAICLLTADKTVWLDREGKESAVLARPNVILEAGFFWGRIGRNRVAFLVEDDGNMELPSDIKGLGFIPIKGDLGETKLRLRKELENAGLI